MATVAMELARAVGAGEERQEAVVAPVECFVLSGISIGAQVRKVLLVAQQVPREPEALPEVGRVQQAVMAQMAQRELQES